MSQREVAVCLAVVAMDIHFDLPHPTLALSHARALRPGLDSASGPVDREPSVLIPRRETDDPQPPFTS